MPNKLLRTVKRFTTAKKLLSGSLTIFRVITYGYKQDKTVSPVIVQDLEYQVFEGKFYNYQLPLRENQKAELLTTNSND